jgi:hypothetical protein
MFKRLGNTRNPVRFREGHVDRIDHVGALGGPVGEIHGYLEIVGALGMDLSGDFGVFHAREL